MEKRAKRTEKNIEKIDKNIEVFIDGFPKYLRKKGYSQNTIKAYTYAVTIFFEQYHEITVTNLEQYRTYLLNIYKANSVNLKISALNHFLKYITATIQESNAKESISKEQQSQESDKQESTSKERKLQESGKQEPTPKERKSQESSIQESNLNADMYMYEYDFPEWRGYTLQTVTIQKTSFIDNVISMEDYELLKHNLKKDHKEFWYFLIRYMAGTGARVSEVVQIKAEHVMLGYIDLYSKGGKVRRIFFPECLTQETKIWLSKQNKKTGFLFLNRQGKRITPRGINSQLKKFAIQYGINPKTVYAHSFRHLFAKLFLQRMNDIVLLSDLMGHESMETTRIYLKKSSLEQRKLIDELITW